MCDIDQSAKSAKNGGVELSLRCKTSGKPITVSNQYGMFCEDMCDLQENIDASKKLEQMLGSMSAMFDRLEDE
jgi:hypothetical protein